METLTKHFWNEGLRYASHNTENSSLTGLRKFRSFYGISPEVFATLWKLIRNKPEGSEPKHLLWCMLFLKNYNTEHVNTAITKVDEKTFRLWTWRFVNLLAQLNVVKWENRLKNSNSNMHVSLDGTDYRIREPQPFNRKWYSHKFKGPGIRYEIGISIVEGEIVWASGGFPCGQWTDLKIAKDVYLRYARNEITLADKGYRFRNFFKQPSNVMEKRILARHETLNGRLKQFSILSNRFRHSLKKRPSVFHALELSAFQALALSAFHALTFSIAQALALSTFHALASS